MRIMAGSKRRRSPAPTGRVVGPAPRDGAVPADGATAGAPSVSNGPGNPNVPSGAAEPAASPAVAPGPVAGSLAAIVAALGLAHIVYMRVMYDDAFISYRYAENLARGLGLVYNPGERVEGYSNFLWTLLMSLVVEVGGRPEAWGPVLSAAVALGTLVLVMWAAHRRGAHGALAGALLAASSCWATWATGGLETALFSGLVTLGAVALMIAVEPGRPMSGRALLVSALALGLACLTRPDGPLVVASAGAIVVALAAMRRLPARAALAWFGVAVGIALAHELWRLGYYGHLLPNTFAVKPPGPTRFVFGWRYLRDAVKDLHLYLLAAPMLAAALLRAPARGLKARDVAIVGAIVVPFTLYLASTGGDFMPVYRFVAPLLPLVTLAAAAALQGVSDRLSARRLAPVGYALVALVSLAYGGLNLRHSWRQQGIWNEGELVSVGWARQEVDDWLRIGDLLRTVALPTDTLATTAAGAVPYRSRLYTIDMLGLNATDLSRFRRLASNRPGHMILIAERELDAHPPQILLAHPLVHPTPARLALSLDLRPEWRDRVLSRYDLLGLTLLGKPVRYVGCALRRDVSERILQAGLRAQAEQDRHPGEPPAEPQPLRFR